VAVGVVRPVHILAVGEFQNTRVDLISFPTCGGVLHASREAGDVVAERLSEVAAAPR
jgi:hypothetical protein